jgi:hypothetical protein
MLNAEELKKLSERRDKAYRLSRDKSTTKHERENAARKVKELEEQIKKAQAESTTEKQYLLYVQQGKEAFTKREEMNWIIGELAATKVQKEYGKGRLRQYAEDIGMNYSTLSHCRTTYIKWPQKTGRPVFWVANALNPHPDRLKIAQQQPELTKQKAQEIISEWNQKKNEGKPPRKSKKKSKANGKDDHPPNPYPISKISTMLVILDGMFQENGNVQQFFNETTLNTEEKIQIKEALQKLLNRVQTTMQQIGD